MAACTGNWTDTDGDGNGIAGIDLSSVMGPDVSLTGRNGCGGNGMERAQCTTGDPIAVGPICTVGARAADLGLP